jgi:hypothetical protein
MEIDHHSRSSLSTTSPNHETDLVVIQFPHFSPLFIVSHSTNTGFLTLTLSPNEKLHSRMSATGETSTVPSQPGFSDRTRFASAIRAIVNELDNDPCKQHSIQQIHRRHRMRRRRLHDIINIFSAIGCATKTSTTHIDWDGTSQILPRLLDAKQRGNVMNFRISLSTLFPPNDCIKLASLTRALLLMFPALGTEIVNLKQLSAFFSRNRVRFKTTLCKLYQITLILGALEIIERTTNPCEVRIKPPFTKLLIDDRQGSPFAIQNLLIQPNDFQQAIDQRKIEFISVCTAHAWMSTLEGT